MEKTRLIRYSVRNHRTEADCLVSWNTFLPVGTHEMCSRSDQKCRCIYVDYKRIKAFAADQ